MDTNRLIRLLQLVEVSRSLIRVVRNEMLGNFACGMFQTLS